MRKCISCIVDMPIGIGLHNFAFGLVVGFFFMLSRCCKDYSWWEVKAKVICTAFCFSKGNAVRVESFDEKECKDISDITNMKIINILYI